MKFGPCLLVVLLLPGIAAAAQRKRTRTPARVSLVFKKIGTETNPKAWVWLQVGKKRTTIMTVNGIPVTESPNSNRSWVPKHAIDALSSWWAGGGDQMYVLHRGDAYMVYHRPLDEQSKTGKFKLVKTVSK